MPIKQNIQTIHSCPKKHYSYLLFIKKQTIERKTHKNIIAQSVTTLDQIYYLHTLLGNFIQVLTFS